MTIPSFPAGTAATTISQALGEAGAVVVTDVLDAQQRETIRTELHPVMQTVHVQTDDKPDAFYPGLTRRATALVAHSSAAASLVVHPLARAMCDTHLLPSGEFGYQLHVSAALEIGPGARRQILHREEDSFTFFPVPRPNLIVASMWAMTDFRADNGGTLIVPGSHRWPAERSPQPHEVVAAEMPAGAVLFWMGGTLHGAGANTSDDWRYGVILTYSPGWVRQEENQYLDVPPEVAKNLDPQVRDLIGYKPYRALGFSVHPDVGAMQDL